MIEEELISFETAKLAKEKGFNEKSQYYCVLDFGSFQRTTTPLKFNTPLENENIYQSCKLSGSQPHLALTPSQSLLQRWLREVHDIRVLVDFETIDDSETAYTFKIVKYLPEGKGRKKDTWDFYETTYSFNQGGGWYKTYEEALELGLVEGLKLIK